MFEALYRIVNAQRGAGRPTASRRPTRQTRMLRSAGGGCGVCGFASRGSDVTASVAHDGSSCGCVRPAFARLLQLRDLPLAAATALRARARCRRHL